MTFDPIECHLMFFEKRQEHFPEVYIKSRLFVGFYPAFFLPSVDPAFCYAVNNLFAVGSESDLTWFFEGGKPLNNTHQFHSVIGGTFIAS